MKKLCLFALLGVLFAACGDESVNVPKDERAYIRVKLDCSNGITVYSIEGPRYVEGEPKERSVDAIGGKGTMFTVVPNTTYTVRANNSIREGRLIGSVVVTSPPADDDAIGVSDSNAISVTIPCN